MESGWRRAFRLPHTRRQAERDIDDEIAFHLAMREAKLRATGLSEADARERARRRFGDPLTVRHECLDIDRALVRRERAGTYLEELMHDLSFALRSLRRAPGFAALAVLTLAVGIGATTAIFSVVYGVLLRPLPFPNAERLVGVYTSFPTEGLPRNSLSAPEYLDLLRDARSFASAGALDGRSYTITGTGRPERIRGATASASFFTTLGIRPALGRLFTADDDRPGAEPVVVLSHRLWQRRFASDPGVTGTTVRLDGVARSVIGVLPRDVRLGDDEGDEAEIYLPLALDPANLDSRGSHYLDVVARLAPGVTLAQAQGELAAYARRAHTEYPAVYPNESFAMTAVPLRDAWYGDVRPTMLVLLGAVALLLLLASVNVANLLLVRAESRQREIAVRAALGAGRGRIVRQLLAETLLLAGAGALLGLPLVTLGVRGLLALNPGVLPLGAEVQADAVVLVVAAVVVLLTTLAAGIVPALQASALDLRSVITEGTVGGTRGTRLRSALVILEVAIATLVLLAAGLVGRSFWRLQHVDPGFTREDALTLDLALTGPRYAEPASITRFYATLLDQLHALPGVRSAAAVSHLPLSGRTGDWMVDVEGRAVAGRQDALPSPSFVFVTRDYFRTIGIPVQAGRVFERRDGERTPPVAVVSEAMAQVAWPDENAVGKRFRLGGGGEVTFPWLTVVGVVGDVRDQALSTAPRPTYYLLADQVPTLIGTADPSMTVLLRTAVDPLSLAESVRRTVWSLDPELAVSNVRTVAGVISGAVARPRFVMVVLVAFGAVALLLAVTGVYGVLSYSVARRSREMGIRMALGARASQVRRLVLVSGLRLAGMGVALGLVAALAGSDAISALLHDVGARDPLTFLAVPIALLLAAIVATLVPAQRATNADVVDVMRAG